ncbi:YceI family protein [Pelagibacterales bacterium SAG-MED31]|nr:YceI family protein [Pelagibacterales bacterium SAG-MED31]
MKKYKFFFILFFFFNITSLSYASERWILDKSLSTVEFELPVLFAKNVKGSFNTIGGFVELDVSKKENNKAIFYVEVNDLTMNYIKYKDLLLSNIFFNAEQFPKAVVDTKKFSYVNETTLEMDVELTIKGKSEMVPLIINLNRLAEELVQIQTELTFSRTAFEIGIGNWKNTSILKDKVKLKTNLFLFREQ